MNVLMVEMANQFLYHVINSSKNSPIVNKISDVRFSVNTEHVLFRIEWMIKPDIARHLVKKTFMSEPVLYCDYSIS
jgi:hypothetical protein